jgi:hypothetical protein
MGLKKAARVKCLRANVLAKNLAGSRGIKAKPCDRLPIPTKWLIITPRAALRAAWVSIRIQASAMPPVRCSIYSSRDSSSPNIVCMIVHAPSAARRRARGVRMNSVKFSQFFVWLSRSISGASGDTAKSPALAKGFEDWARPLATP